MKSRHKLALLTGVYLALRLPLLNTPLLPDETFFTSDFLTALPPLFGTWPEQWSRQLAVHPPFLSFLYFFWIRIFGDSLLSIRFLPLLCGLASIFLCYALATRLIGDRWGFWCALMLTSCGSHIHYSVTAVYAIFELTSFLAALLALIIYCEGNKEKRFLYASLFAGVLVSYHFIVFMVLSSALLVLYRRRVSPPLAYITLCVLFSALIAIHAYDSWESGIFASFHHRRITVSALTSWIIQLPDGILRFGHDAL